MKIKGVSLCFLWLILSVACLAQQPETLFDRKSQLGKKVTFTGIAQNEKLGAVVILEGGGSIYLADKTSWETEMLNKRVRVTGLLDEFDLPVATHKDGLWSAGVSESGSAYILRKSTWELVK